MAKMSQLTRPLLRHFAAFSVAMAAVVVLLQQSVVAAQSLPAPPVATSPYSYADVADLATLAPAVVDAKVRKVIAVPPEKAPGVAAGYARILVEADVLTLIRGSGALAARITYLADVKPLPNGKLPKFKKQRVLLFARLTPGNTGSVQLIAPDAQLPWDAATDALTRRILGEAVRADAPPAILGIANGFHVPGTLPGEGETQLFLRTETGVPVSLSVIRRPDAPPQWAAAFGEIVDGSAAVPARNTLTWYRLACGLPRSLPVGALAGTEGADRETAVADYRFVLAELADCTRTRTPPRR